MSAYSPPVGITGHAGVLSCLEAAENVEGRNHDVTLRDGWLFSAGMSSGQPRAGFRTVAEFLAADPVRNDA